MFNTKHINLNLEDIYSPKVVLMLLSFSIFIFTAFDKLRLIIIRVSTLKNNNLFDIF